MLSEDINGHVTYHYNCEIVKLNKDRVEKSCAVFNSTKTKKKNKDVANLYAKNMKVSMLFSSYMGSSAENLFFSSSLKSCFKFIQCIPPLPLNLNSSCILASKSMWSLFISTPLYVRVSMADFLHLLYSMILSSWFYHCYHLQMFNSPQRAPTCAPTVHGYTSYCSQPCMNTYLLELYRSYHRISNFCETLYLLVFNFICVGRTSGFRITLLRKTKWRIFPTEPLLK